MNYIRGFLQKLKVIPTDEELGDRTAVYPTDRRGTVSTYPEEGHIEASEKLQEFRLLVGITTHGSFKAPRGFDANQRPIVTTSGRPAPNRGIYATVVDNEIKQKKTYKFFSRGINACLGIQLVVAATLTALGASSSSHGAVTAFGGINTVIAGFLTYLKGSGLPGRLQYFQHEWTKVREYIEQVERDLCRPNDIDLADEVRYIRWMFENVREDIEANRPDRFVGLGGPKANHLASGQPERSGGDVKGMWRSATDNNGHQRMETELGDGLKDMRKKVSDLNHEAGSAATSEMHQLRSAMSDDLGRLKSQLRQKLSDLELLQRDLEKKEGSLRGGGEDKMKEMGDLEKEIESYGRSAVDKEHEMEVKATDATVDAEGRIKATLELSDPFKEK